MGFRPYTGFDGVASGRRAGTQRFIELVTELSDGGLWNNGSYTVRLIRGKTSQSVHGTGRAVDLSWRGGSHGGFGDYAKAKEWIDFLTANAAALEIEMILDYYRQPYGAGYKCDRDATKVYTSHAITGAPGGDWIHVEVSPKVADDPAFFERVLPALRGQASRNVPEPEPDDIIEQPGPEDYPGRPIGVGFKRKKVVKAIQQRVGVGVDGIFGPKTLKAVQEWQKGHGLRVAEKVNKSTWVAMFGVPEGDATTKVKTGEGWIQIATRALGDRSRWPEIAGLNGGEGRVLHVGDVLLLPRDDDRQAATVKVRAGDGWLAIANRALGDRSRWMEIAALNGGEDRVLQAGDELILPS